MLRRHKRAVDSLPHDVVELILTYLPVKALLRFKLVSKTWKSIIESQSFKQGHLIRRRLSRGPDVLFMSLASAFSVDGDVQRFEFGSSVAYTAKLPASSISYCYGSCDGLVCLYSTNKYKKNIVVNPATRWYRRFPISNIHRLIADEFRKGMMRSHLPNPGFGKDKFRGVYKMVWLYNSYAFCLDNATTCEVFDFSTNAWRYVFPASPYRILPSQWPVYFDGSLHWLTEGEETKVLSLDLHTETFHITSKPPFPHAPDPRSVNLCILDNRLCVSHKNSPTQVISSFDSSSSTWNVLCSIDLTKTLEWFGREPDLALTPLAIVDKNKLLLQGRVSFNHVMVYDLETKSSQFLFKPINPVAPVYYYESLLSVL